MTGQKLYLAGPLFSAAEREYCVRIRSILAARFDVYVPHVDGGFLPDLIASGLPPQVARRQVFAADIEAIRASDFLLIVLDGRVVDEGAAFELGVAWSLGKSCLGIKEDFRQLTATGDNPMIECALRTIFRSLAELKEWVDAK
jgi:nucleoside 2-deoxyribosyltransferase